MTELYSFTLHWEWLSIYKIGSFYNLYDALAPTVYFSEMFIKIEKKKKLNHNNIVQFRHS